MSANAISGEGMQYQLFPEQMKESLGVLPGSPAASLVLKEQEAVFSWDMTMGLKCHSYDEVLLLTYNVAQQPPVSRKRPFPERRHYSAAIIRVRGIPLLSGLLGRRPVTAVE